MSHFNGLLQLFFCPSEYQAEYGCKNIDVDGPQLLTHPILCVAQLSLGIVSEILYIFCMYSLRKHLHISCYKILFYIGIIDMCGLVVGAIMPSTIALLSGRYCDFPITQYLYGGLAMAFWFAETTSEFILAFDRCLELLAPRLAAIVFKDNRTWCLLLFPTIYASVSWIFTRPILFSSTKFAFFFDPYGDYNITVNEGIYTNHMHTFNNTLVSLVLCTTYAIFCICWIVHLLKMRAIPKTTQLSPKTQTTAIIGPNSTNNKNNTNKTETAAGNNNNMAVQLSFVQVILISFFNANAAGIGAYMENFPIFPELIIIEQFNYVLTHAAPPFIYLICNRTIRDDIRNLLRRIFCRNTTVVGVSGLTIIVRSGVQTIGGGGGVIQPMVHAN